MAAFAVGVAEQDQLLNPKNVAVGDVLIGLPSSGIHSNGYSLVRHVLGIQSDDDFNQLPEDLKTTLLTPTALYAKPVWPLVEAGLLQAMAHITGGGLTENLPRAYETTLSAQINWGAWPILPIFNTLQAAGQLTLEDMLLTFNNGLGMVLIVKPAHRDGVLASLAAQDQTAYVIGEMVPYAGAGVVYSGGAPW